MNKEFIACLEHIIDLEKTRMVQEDLLKAMTDKANRLAVRRRFQQPVLQEAQYRPVAYHIITGDEEEQYELSGKVIGGVVGLLISSILAGTVHEALFLSGFILVPLGVFIGAIIAMAHECRVDQVAREEADAKMQQNYQIEIQQNQIEYQQAIKQYDLAVAADEQRVRNELTIKNNVLRSIDELKTKIQSTETALRKYYDAAGIYDLYRNIIAVSYFHEYLVSGICTELGGPNGAYITFKNEMYNRMKIERLDTIIDYLGQLHFDNLKLIEVMRKVSYSVGTVSQKMDRAIEEQKSMGSQLSGQLSAIHAQNALSLYNQECQQKELESLNWLSQYQAFWK